MSTVNQGDSPSQYNWLIEGEMNVPANKNSHMMLCGGDGGRRAWESTNDGLK